MKLHINRHAIKISLAVGFFVLVLAGAVGLNAAIRKSGGILPFLATLHLPFKRTEQELYWALRHTFEQKTATVSIEATIEGDPSKTGNTFRTEGMYLSWMSKGMNLPETRFTEKKEESPVVRTSHQGIFSVKGMEEKKALDFSVEYRLIPPVTYLKMNGEISLPSGFLLPLGKIADKWIAIEKDMNGSMFAALLPAPLEFAKTCKANSVVMRETIQSVQPLRLFSSFSKKQEDETVANIEESVRRYTLTFNKEVWQEVLQNFVAAAGCSSNNTELMDAIKNISSFDVFVGASSGFIRGVDVEMKPTLSIRLSEFAVPFVVEVPEGAVSIRELLLDMMKSRGGFRGLMNGGGLLQGL
ncbi:MAG: hypothetical protein UU48_C0002G0078 [Candidatus Uhrbacteria bacterium GW2011_GWF2_41_16]|uniref:Uncharacterized protein n=2 Tax=Candidatus Uhriibacteriota TaxID=1752732 RepID=A0A0G0VC76_9BACT|nr:MAG: hypothetical protein UU31_C0003G0086 [Candidatus Uhrbacteria bacterium GW2011_GWA2_41_10]KKR87563.1 MAG: hypothetical protein UU35_C0002G0064 [Candidatus Uhrbacteria bacterium GW2011_GWC2_41_11]KKR98543.1 MAG: hypothetical protein UU48_C0002G0078 [Candidatus Uhrbacteria bacterium GW2011_GWF2_41_16]HBO99920.1 hypothetical protein [Candidatus Uhrbacteria bacterium]